MAKDVFHVVPHDDSWAVKREGNERASSTHGTQKEAIDAARTLARDGDDVVIHRPDGTIRERTTVTAGTVYTAASNGSGNGNGGTIERAYESATVARASIKDTVSVGSRVSWQAVLAGLAVAVTVYVFLTLLAVAIGVSTVDHVRSRSFAVGAAIVGIFNLLVALFLGGYVTSRMSTRETPGEAIVYGVLVWAALFFTVLLSGINLGGNFGMVAQVARPTAADVTPSPDDQRRRDAILARGEQVVSEMNPVAIAWWAVGGMVLSVLASIGGACAGAGPELTFRRVLLGEPRPVRQQVSSTATTIPQPA